MLGGGSFQLARISGIRIGVHVSWFVILFLAILWLQQPFENRFDGDATKGFAAAVLVALLFFGSILLHELGHAVAARREGIEVSGIELFFFGGFMRMSRDSATPGQEFRVAAAGPLVTLAIALVTGALTVALVGVERFRNYADLSSGTPTLAEAVIAFTFSANVLLLCFNLIPAFPLDGGRIARAAAWRLTGDRLRATVFAARVGQLFAILLIGYGLWVLVNGDTYGGLYTVVLGWMLGSAARSAVVQSAVTSRLAGVTVADVMDSEPVTIPAGLPAGQAFEEFFLRYQGWPWFAVVEEDGRFAGLAHRAAVEGAPPMLPVRAVAADGGAEERVRADTPLEALLSSEPLSRLGALMAVDAEGRLRGVITLEQVSRALQSRLAPRPG